LAGNEAWTHNKAKGSFGKSFLLGSALDLLHGKSLVSFASTLYTIFKIWGERISPFPVP
jgi:hypothetical protein